MFYGIKGLSTRGGLSAAGEERHSIANLMSEPALQQCYQELWPHNYARRKEITVTWRLDYIFMHDLLLH